MERPILMTTESVKAILDGRKTMTRRVCKQANDWQQQYDHAWVKFNPKYNWWEFKGRSRFSDLIETFVLTCPHGEIADRLWVREAFMPYCGIASGKCVIRYKDGVEIPVKLPDGYMPSISWKSSIFMPRWASRLTLEIIGVRVERLQEIENRPEDYKAEGYTPLMIGKSVIDGKPFEGSADFAWFESLWDSLNAKRGFGWDKNPWVWVIKLDNIGVRVK